jgi:nucleoside-diphosphate-sugar epimerase
MMTVNVLGTHNVLELARRTDAKVVFSSSAAVYGDMPAPQRDDGGMHPINAYGYTKAASEYFCRAYAKDYGVDVIALRYFNTYGIGEDVKGSDASMVYHFMQDVLKGRTIEIYGDGSQRRDFVCVTDVAAANLLAMEKKGLSGKSFNVGSGKATSFNELVAAIEKAAKKKAKIKYVENPLKGAYQFYTQADLTNTTAELGFRPSYTLDSGLGEMSKFYAKKP